MEDGRRRGTATVVFTDLVGSTELLARLGESAFDDLRRAHFAALRGAIERYGGTEVKTLGDGILAVFGSAADAVDAAVAMQRATAGRGPPGTEGKLALRVGVALGDVGFEEGDVFGTPVVEAARLVAAARPGQILATTVVRVVAGARTQTRFTDVGSLVLKGLPAPVAACEVDWEILSTAAVPLPPLLSGVGPWTFVGREPELERLEVTWKEADTGTRRLILIGGEPGIGKTRLAGEFARRVHADGAVVLAGRCDEDMGVPFQPFVEALRQYVTAVDAPFLGRHGGELTRLVPEITASLPGLPEPLRSDPETERYRLFDAVAAWLAGVSAEAPVLLVLDDLHWAARPTLLLLRHVVRSVEPMRILIAGTYRDTEPGPGLTELLADLRRDGAGDRLSLAGLDDAGAEAFLGAAAGHDLDADDRVLARAIRAETEGNPFFVGEVLRHLAESGAVAKRDGRWVLEAALEELGIPDGVREVVARRLSRLSPEANRVLRVAAVGGAEFDLPVLAAVADANEETVLFSVDEALAARLVAEVRGAGVPRYRFSHALVRATVYDQLAAGRRVLLHRRIGEAIEAVHAGHLDPHVASLAHHFGRAAVAGGDAGKAAHYATQAGDRALAQLAHDEAAAYYGLALELLAPKADGRLELLISLGEAQRRAGIPAHRETLLAAAGLARERGDADALARAALANSRAQWWTTSAAIDNERIEALEHALEATDEGVLELRARLLAALAVETIYASDRSRRVALSDEALAAARRLGDPATLADVLLARYRAIAAPSTLGERIANTAELLTLTEDLDDPVRRFGAWVHRFRASFESGDVAEGDRALASCEALAAELAQPVLRWSVLFGQAGRAWLAGALDESERKTAAARDLGLRIGLPATETAFLAQSFYICRERATLAAIEPTLRRLTIENPQLPTSCAVLAVVQCELGQREEARETLGRLAATGFDLPFDLIWLFGMAESAVAASDLGDTEAAAVLLERLTPYTDQFATIAGSATVIGAVSGHVGMLATTLGRFDEADAHLSAAAEAHARIGAPILLARTRLEQARLCLTRGAAGDVERARALLGQVLATARELGLVAVERRAVSLLA